MVEIEKYLLPEDMTPVGGDIVVVIDLSDGLIV